MQRNSELVRQFYYAIDIPLPERPGIPSLDTLATHQRLITEEYQEVVDALTHIMDDQGHQQVKDLVSLVHELLDLLYVTYGALLVCGVEPDEVFREIHRANMQKVTGPRRADGKPIKPVDWQPANVAAILARQWER
jgi:predicted HAD superfamily Cof-like phosphohydrolase